MFPTEGFQPTLSKLTAVLDRLQIRYHLTGGIAAVAYGEPRMTNCLWPRVPTLRFPSWSGFGTAVTGVAGTCAGFSQGRLATSFAS